jgi:ribosome-associated protein
MVLYEDTRQQAGKHENIRKYCEKHGIEIIRQALNVGDYQIAGKGDITVDTKYGVPELAMDIFQEHERFRDECRRAQRCGITLIVLTEETLPGGRLDNWRSPIGWDGLPMHRFRPEVLRKAMITMQEEYGVKFRFCHPRDTGRRMIAYLEGRMK